MGKISLFCQCTAPTCRNPEQLFEELCWRIQDDGERGFFYQCTAPTCRNPEQLFEELRGRVQDDGERRDQMKQKHNLDRTGGLERTGGA
jgi:hypothetical protein